MYAVVDAVIAAVKLAPPASVRAWLSEMLLPLELPTGMPVPDPLTDT